MESIEQTPLSGDRQTGAENFERDFADAARNIENIFEATTSSIADSFNKAARRGRVSFSGIFADLKKEAQDLFIEMAVEKPVKSLLSSLFPEKIVGARSNGGFVARGQAYLVGENGPELFVPQNQGRIETTMATRPIDVTLNVNGVSDVQGFRRSENQIAASISDALTRGLRNG